MHTRTVSNGIHSVADLLREVDPQWIAPLGAAGCGYGSVRRGRRASHVVSLLRNRMNDRRARSLPLLRAYKVSSDDKQLVSSTGGE